MKSIDEKVELLRSRWTRGIDDKDWKNPRGAPFVKTNVRLIQAHMTTGMSRMWRALQIS